MVMSILELIGAIVVWGAILPLARAAFAENRTIIGILYGIILVVSAACGVYAGLNVLGHIIGSLWAILVIIGVLAIVWFLVNLITGNREK